MRCANPIEPELCFLLSEDGSDTEKFQEIKPGFFVTLFIIGMVLRRDEIACGNTASYCPYFRHKIYDYVDL